MAGTVTVTRDPRKSGEGGKLFERLSIVWTCDASGNATGSLTNLFGWLIKATTIPAGGGSAPTDNYDITLVNEDGADAAEGKLIDRDTANTETAFPMATGAIVPALFAGGTVTFTVANAGNTKGGTCVLYLVEDL